MFWSLFLTKKLRSYSPGVTDQSKTQGATCPPQIQEIQRNDGPEKRWCLRNRDDQEKGQEGVVDVIRSYILHNRYIYINTWCITMYTPKLFLSKWLLSSHLRIIDPNSPPKKKKHPTYSAKNAQISEQMFLFSAPHLSWWNKNTHSFAYGRWTRGKRHITLLTTQLWEPIVVCPFAKVFRKPRALDSTPIIVLVYHHGPLTDPTKSPSMLSRWCNI